MEGNKRVGFYRYSILNRGGDRVVLDYANHLADVGYDVTFFTARNETVLGISKAIKFEMLTCRNEIGFLLYGASRSFDVDLMVVDIIHLPLFLSLRNRVVYFAQAYDVEYYKHALQRAFVDLLYRTFFLTGLPVITVSECLTDIFRQRYSAGNTYTVTNGISLATFFPDPDTELIALKGNRKALVFLARGDHYRKGYDLGEGVTKMLGREFSDRCELWVCGEHIDEQSFGSPVRNFGVVSDDRLRRILSSADIFFYPTRHEGFGLFPLEAMACGCVAVTTEAVPYARQIPCIRTARIGDIDEMYQYIKELIEQPDLLEHLRNNSMTEAPYFDAERSKIEFERVIRLLCEKGSRK
jgi:glycosyltransferase involved in cell wall biosynthesis